LVNKNPIKTGFLREIIKKEPINITSWALKISKVLTPVKPFYMAKEKIVVKQQ